MELIGRLCAIVVFACVSSTACAQEIFKCKQADGGYAYQGEPCPENASQQSMRTDNRGNIQVEPTETRRASRAETAPSKAAGIPAGETARTTAAPAADLPNASRQAASPIAANARSSAPTRKMSKSDPNQGPSPAMGVLAMLGLVACFVGSLWYMIAQGKTGDVIGTVVDAATWSEDDEDRDQTSFGSFSSPIVRYGALVLLAFVALAWFL